MPVVRGRQTTLGAGEIDPDLFGRDDLAFYDGGAASLRNMMPYPAGLCRPRGGFREAGLRYRTQMSEVTGATLTTPGSGVAMHADFGSAVAIGAVDVVDIVIAAAHTDAFEVQYSTDNATWTRFGSDAFDSGANGAARSRRAALDPGASVTARYWRVKVSAGATGDYSSISDMDFWIESGTESDVVGLDFAFDASAAYVMFVTAGHVDIYRAETRVAAVKIPHTSAQVAVMTEAQSLDTMLLFHNDVAPWRIFRQGGDSEWDFRTQDWEHIPDVDFGDTTYTNGVNEIQELRLEAMTSGVERFTLELGTEITDSITYNSTPATMAASLTAALEALDRVGSGNVTVTNIDTSPDIYEIEFTGEAGQKPWPLMVVTAQVLGSGDEQLVVTRTQKGKYGGEAIMSSSRGWPSCGTFYQGRTALGGFKGRPSSILFSVTGDFFNLDTEIEEADGAFELRIDADQVKRIRRLYAGRNLQIFTDAAEFYIADRAISKEGPISATIATRRGIEEGLGVFEIDGSTVFVQEGGDAVRGFLFDDAEQSYRSNNLSVLASHLMSGPAALALVRARGTNEPDRVWIARDDGSAVVLTALPAQEFNAWSPVSTDGAIKAFAAEDGRTLYAAIKRTIDGSPSYRIEIYDADALYDGQKTVTLDPAASTATGFDHLEGETVEMWIDGRPGHTAVVTGGAIAMPFEGEEVIAGLGYTPEFTSLPLRADVGGSTADRMKRIFRVALGVQGTGSLSIAANGRPARTVPVRQYRAGGLGPTDEDLFTGTLRVDGLIGWSKDGQFTVSQPYRAPIEIRWAVFEARIS